VVPEPPRSPPPSREPLVHLPAAKILVATLLAGLATAAICAWLTQRLTAPPSAPQGATAPPAATAPPTATAPPAATTPSVTTAPPQTAASTTPSATATTATPPDPVRSSLLGSAVALVVTVGGIVILMPWKTRPAGTWAVIWLGGTVGRLLITPVVGLLVYSATPVRLDAFLLSLAGTYLACLAAEVATAASGLARILPAAEAEIRRDSSRP